MLKQKIATNETLLMSSNFGKMGRLQNKIAIAWEPGPTCVVGAGFPWPNLTARPGIGMYTVEAVHKP